MHPSRFLFVFLSFFTLLSANGASAQEKGFDLNFLVGVNIGATTPVPIPGVLKITGYNPRFNSKLGAGLLYFFDRHWGIGTGLTLEWKGMKVHTRVTEVHLSIDVPQIGTLTGYVTGRNTTKVNTLYLVQPVYAAYRINRNWQVKAGIYMAETLSRKFKGEVRNVEIVVESPLSHERRIEYATLDYSSHTRKFDIGLLTGAEFTLNRHVGFFADFTWGLRPYFSGNVPIEFTMRNVYFSAGAVFRVNRPARF